MQVQTRNLQRRASGYFFRMGIPKDLQSRYEGKREIVKSLKTKDSNLAAIKAHEIAEIYKHQFSAYRSGEKYLCPLTLNKSQTNYEKSS